MKKTFIGILSLYFIIGFTCSVKAATYQADQLEVGQFLAAGDIIEFGSGVYNGATYNTVNICKDSYIYHPSVSPYLIKAGRSYVLPFDVYVRLSSCGNASGGQDADGWTRWEELQLYVDTTKSYFHLGDNQPISSISLNEGETKRVYFEYEGGTDPITIKWTLEAREDPIVRVDLDNDNNNYYDISYGEGMSIVASLYCPSGRTFDNYAGSSMLIINNVPSNPDKKDNEPQNDDKEEDKTEDSPGPTPQTPSTVPSGTVQVSIGSNDKSFANIKALNQFPHDSVNQKIIADLYAANLKKRAEILVQKNLFPPFGVKNEWKASSHTVRWNNLNVKKGDTIVIVWYTPTFWGHASTLKMIPATVVADGTIEFTIPSMGDMSVMSIVKLR